jgi:energy-coupling factor transporter ATP-binding protein EcfA2
VLKKLTIDGLRGFAQAETIEPAVPNGLSGSGITVIVGPNNSGKSTIIEALAARKPGNAPTFNVGIRNRRADSVTLTYEFEGHTAKVASLRAGSSATSQTGTNFGEGKLYVVPSRRHFNPYFGNTAEMDRNDFRTTYSQHGQVRSATLTYFEGRLLGIERDHGKFDPIIKRLIPDLIDWSIDQDENNQYYLKFTSASRSHSSAGVGDGIVSAFVIMSALYDSEPGETIVIDEPELSLHPQVQRRLCRVLEDTAKDRQVILASHSPYFVSPDALRNGGRVCRCWDRADHIEIHSADIARDCGLATLLAVDVQKPHIFGLDAREVFFVDDRVIVLEGQEDVVFWPRAVGEPFASEYGLYGWGAGGASNVRAVLKLLKSLGFQKVVAVLDNDVPSEVKSLTADFPKYHIMTIPAPDIRNKKAEKARAAKEGLLDHKNVMVKTKHVSAMDKLKKSAADYMSS